MGLFAGTGIRVLRCTYVNSLLLPVALSKFRVWEPLTAPAAGERRASGGAVARPAALRAAGDGGGVARRGPQFPARTIAHADRREDVVSSGRHNFPSLSVFFPAYNDAPSLPGLLAKTFAALRAHVADYEVIVVNDGSHDDTAKVLEELRGQYQPRTAGGDARAESRIWRRAAQRASQAPRKDFVFYTDGDGQYDVGEAAAAAGADDARIPGW